MVDAQGRDCPDWVTGELWIGGAGVALGYRGDPAQTAERFVDYNGERWYRTGDLGVTGLTATWVSSVGATTRSGARPPHRTGRDRGGAVRPARRGRAVAVTIGKPVALAAAFVPTDPTTQPRTDELLAALRQLLPDYMVPTHLQAIDTLPLSGNGKVDRQALVALLATQASTRAAYDPPQPGLECEVADIWRRCCSAPPFQNGRLLPDRRR